MKISFMWKGWVEFIETLRIFYQNLILFPTCSNLVINVAKGYSHRIQNTNFSIYFYIIISKIIGSNQLMSILISVKRNIIESKWLQLIKNLVNYYSTNIQNFSYAFTCVNSNSWSFILILSFIKWKLIFEKF